MKVDDEALLKISRKYGLVPGSLKNHVFVLLDEGLTRPEIRYALRRFRDPENPTAFTNTIRKYESLWEKAQARLTANSG